MSIFKLIKQTLKTTIFLTFVSFMTIMFSQPTYASSVNINDLNYYANIERNNAGLASLNLNPMLNTAALNKANHMIANNYWAHVAPDGMTPWNFIDASGYVYSTAGENLALHYTSSNGVVAGWMASPSHKANVMNDQYTDVGYAVVDGVLLGNQTTLVVAMYGSQKIAPAVIESIIPHSSEVAVIESASQPVNNLIESSIVEVDSEIIDSKEIVSESNVEVVALIESPAPTEHESNLSVDAQNSGLVAGIMSIIPESINKYTELKAEYKVGLLLISLLATILSIKFILFNLRNKNGDKYIWFRKRPLAGSTILGLTILFSALSSFGAVL